MKYLILFIVPLLICCTSSRKNFQTNTRQPTETNYNLKNNNFPIEIIEAFVPFVGSSVIADDKTQISYELTILNNYFIPFILKSVEIYDTENPKFPIAVFDSAYLNVHFVRHGLSKENNPLELKGNEFGVANLWLTLEKSDSIPTEIFHKLIFERTKQSNDPNTYPMEVARINIPQQTSISLGLPFKKGKWLYSTSGHRDSRYVTDGKSSYAQRYAIDWILLNKDGSYAKDDKALNNNWITYGVELLAVADGKVVDIKDGIAENIPFNKEKAIPITRETIAGNYIVIDIGNDIYAIYAHLIPNSAKIKLGDQVKKGQVIGLIGNSGNSDAPHLHFHLETKSNRTLGGEGIPYHFGEFNQLIKYTEGEIETIFDMDKIPLKDLNPSKRYNELPIGNGIIEF